MAGTPIEHGSLTHATLRNATVRRLVVAFASITLAEWVLGTTVAVHAYAVGGALAVGLAQLIIGSRVREVIAGTAIVTRGERDDTYHVLLSGRAQVVVDGAIRQELFPGDGFGEIAVLHRVPRRASVIACDQSTVLTIDGETVRAAVREHGGDSLATLSG